MNLLRCVVGKLSAHWLLQWATGCAHCLSCIVLLLLGRVVAGVGFRCQAAPLEKASSNVSVQAQCLPGKLEKQKKREW